MDLVARVQRAAEAVYLEMGPGFDEKAYRVALAVEFRDREIDFQEEKSAEVCYKGTRVGFKFIDFLVEGRLAVELKTKKSLGRDDEAQLIASAQVLNRPGLLINFPDEPREKDKIKGINRGGSTGDGGPEVKFLDRRIVVSASHR